MIKTFMGAALGVFAMTCVSLPAAAEPGSSGFADSIRRLDANGDGTISRAEAQSAAMARFSASDKDHDGKLTADEIFVIEGMTPAECIASVDKDGDGAMSSAEYLAYTLDRFDAWDTDHDGNWSPAEQQVLIGAG